VSVLNSFKISSNHRMVRCKLKLNTRLERKKFIRGKPPVSDLENLGKHRQTFEIKLIGNRFSALEEFEGKKRQH